MLCCLCLLLHPRASQDPPTRAGCMSTLLTGRDCAMARGKLPWNTFTLPGVLPGLDLQEKFGLSAEILWNISAHPFVERRSPGQKHRTLAAPTEVLPHAHVLLVLLSGTKLPSLDIQGDFLWKCWAEQQDAEGLGGQQGKAGCCLLPCWVLSPSGTDRRACS